MSRKHRKWKRATARNNSGTASAAVTGNPAKTDTAADPAPIAAQPKSKFEDSKSSSEPAALCGRSRSRAAQLLDLPDDLLHRVTEQLPPNEVPCSLRLVCRELASRLRSPRHTAIRVGTAGTAQQQYWYGYVMYSRDLVPAHLLLGRWGAPGAGRCLTLTQKQQLLCCAARCGSMEVVQQLECALGCEVPKEAAWAAAAEGHGHVCDWLLARVRPAGMTDPCGDGDSDSDDEKFGVWLLRVSPRMLATRDACTCCCWPSAARHAWRIPV